MSSSYMDLEKILKVEVEKGLRNANQRYLVAMESKEYEMTHPDALFKDADERAEEATRDFKLYTSMYEILETPKQVFRDEETLQKFVRYADGLTEVTSKMRETLSTLMKMKRQAEWVYTFNPTDKEQLKTILDEAVSRKAWGGTQNKIPHLDFKRGVHIQLEGKVHDPKTVENPQVLVAKLATEAALSAPAKANHEKIIENYRFFMTTEGQTLAQGPLKVLRSDLSYKNSPMDPQPSLGATMVYRVDPGSPVLKARTVLEVGYGILPEKGTFIYLDKNKLVETDDPMVARSSKEPLMKIVTELEVDATNTDQPLKAQYSRLEITSFSDEIQSKARNRSLPKEDAATQLSKANIDVLKAKEPAVPSSKENLKPN